jgi:integrase
MEACVADRVVLSKSVIDNANPTEKIFRVWDAKLSGYHLRVYPNGTKSFMLRYHNNGRNLDYLIGQYGDLTPTEARARAEKARGKARADQIDLLAERKVAVTVKKEQIKKQKRDKLRTLGMFFETNYLPWAQNHIKSVDETVRLMKTDFKHLKNTDLKDISPWLVEKMVKDAKSKKLANATINRKVATLKSILSKAVEWGVIDSTPLARVKPLKLDKAGRIRYLTDVEEVALRDALESRQHEHRLKRESHSNWAYKRGVEPPPLLNGRFTDHLFPIVLVALNTGLRRGEIFKLEWPDINFKKRLLTVKGEGAKSGNTRHIPMNDEAFAALVGWRNQTEANGLVFSSPVTGEELNNIKKSWAMVISSAGIKNFRFHDLRHTFASKLVMAGVDLNTVRELLGHASIEMTLRYAHLAPEHKANAVALLNK